MRKLFIFVYSVALLGLPASVFAATLKIQSQDSSVDIGELVKVDVVIELDREVINTVAGKISIPAERFEVADMSDGNSIIPVWIERPQVSEDNVISFAGIIPGGYGYTTGHLFSFFIIPKNSGDDTFSFSEATVLLHDGQGTPSRTVLSPLNITITEEWATSTREAIIDTDLPEEFTPTVTRHPDLLDNRWVVIFTTQDKGSGIDYYAVQERRREAIDAGAWQKTVSPHVLSNQNLRNYIYVKAVDKRGNERIAMIRPMAGIWYTDYLIWSILLIIMLVGIWIFFRLRKKIR